MGYVLDFQEIDQTQVAVVGGKGALLGELSRIEGIPVPPGLCVTTDAFQRILAEVPSIDARLARHPRQHSVRRGRAETGLHGQHPRPELRERAVRAWPR